MQKESGSIPLCVDLDGTLVRTDMLIESALMLIKQNFGYLICMLVWLISGKSQLKEEIAKRLTIDASNLPYAEDFLEYLKKEHAIGRKLILVTASNYRIADSVASYLEIFSEVIASDRNINLKSFRKRDALVKKYGAHNFDYAGNDIADVPVLQLARQSILVNPTRSLLRKTQNGFSVIRVFQKPALQLSSFLRALRAHQWFKNVLLFLPLLASHNLTDPIMIFQVSAAFGAFSFCASGVYIINDIFDLNSDRCHPQKRFRVFASGLMSLKIGFVLAPLLITVSLIWSLVFLNVEFAVLLMIYIFLNLAYSFWLKLQPIVDILILSGFYTLRVIAGAAAISVYVSFWLLAFSTFLFLSLAIVKRYTELVSVGALGMSNAVGRGYKTTDLSILASLGSSAGYLSVLVLALYINSADVSKQYMQPELLWMLCPLLLYWISRLWLKTHRGEIHHDPVVFAMTDWQSQLSVLIGAVIILVAAVGTGLTFS